MTTHRIDFKYLNKDSIIIDAGACQGAFINLVKKKLNCKIYAIEPNINHITFLQAQNYSNVEIIKQALVGQNYPKYIEFTECIGMPKWGNIYNRKIIHPKLLGTKKYKVKTLCINDIFKIHKINHIHYFKIDIEEAEFDIFFTMTEQTAKKIDQFSVEFHKCNHTDIDIDRFVKKVDKLGYRYQWVEKGRELWGINKCLNPV